MAAFAFAVRIAWVLAVAAHYALGHDALFYRAGGVALAAGHGYVNSWYIVHPPVTAQFPPLFTTYLGVFAWLFGDSRLVAHVAVCLAGTAVVVCTGLLGRKVAGDQVGIVAATVAAVYPGLVVPDGSLMAETLFTLVVIASVLVAYRVHERPTLPAWTLLGMLLGLATLTRGEGVLLVPLLIGPLIASRARVPLRVVGGASVAVVACVLVLVPWTVRNYETFHHPVLLADDSGTLVRGANCSSAYGGRLLGSWDALCDINPGIHQSTNEAVEASRELHAGVHYASTRLWRIPVVVAARLGRTFGVFRPVQEVRLGTSEGRPFGAGLMAWIAFFALAPFAVIGAWAIRGRGVYWAPLAAVVAMVVLTSVLSYGNTRFGVAMQPVVVVFAAIAFVHLFGTTRDRLRRTARPSRTPPDDTEDVALGAATRE